MKKILFPIVLISATTLLITSCISSFSKTDSSLDNPKAKHSIIYFTPEVFPDITEIKSPSSFSFFTAISDKIGNYRQFKMNKVETTMPYEDVDINSIKEICINNGSDFAIVPKIKFFKVGLGKYVFSNQVIVSLKMYNAQGKLIKESSYDTFKKNKRMIGSTENSIRIGAMGAMQDLIKEIRILNRQAN